MPKPISAIDRSSLRVVVVTMDTHLAGALARAEALLRDDFAAVTLTLHAADEWGSSEEALTACLADIAQADILVVTMLFLEDHISAVLPALAARREGCLALVACLSAAEVVRLTKLGVLSMSGETNGLLSLFKRLSGRKTSGAASGKEQMKMLRKLPRLLRFIPGPAQDLRAFFLTMQYWLAGSSENLANLVRLLVRRYGGEAYRATLRTARVAPPVEYPETGLYHPRASGRIVTDPAAVPSDGTAGTVGLLLLRSYILGDNAAHYDGVIEALEARGLRVIPAFASGLDARPAIERYFLPSGRRCIDALVSLTGFSLVGGPAYNDASAAVDSLSALDIPYIGAHPLEFQTIEQWQGDARGLTPVEATMMVAIPEIDGAILPMTFGGRASGAGAERRRDMVVHAERAARLAARVARLVALRKTPRSARRVAVVLFNFPPNAGAVGTAAYLSVFASLYNLLRAMKQSGYQVALPADIAALRQSILDGNAGRFGTEANVIARIPAAEITREEPWLRDIERQWGPAPGRALSDGSSVFVLGAQFGNVLVGIQPGFGYEGDPMRLLFERGFAPTYAFSAFYRYLRGHFGADAVLHFGTHGALEFMPGKQVGLSDSCWPDRLIGDMPNFYLYASNNPSEGALAKRRAGATLISYLTPPVTKAGLYRGLLDLKSSLDRWRNLSPETDGQTRAALAAVIQSEAATLDLAAAAPAWHEEVRQEKIEALLSALLDLEYTLIPDGLHVLGEPPRAEARSTLLDAAEITDPAVRTRLESLLAANHEIPAILHALDAGYIRPAPGGDLLRTLEILPTGRNLHGFDPFRIPSRFALADGAQQAARLLEKYRADTGKLPESVALVLWGSDNLKSEGGPIAQALWLLGAMPRYDGYGRLCGAALIPLDQLGRPRIDVIATISGIFRDLLPLQTRLLAEATLLAANAPESEAENFVRKHALAYQAAHGGDIAAAARRVFGNTDGAYGANVNLLLNQGGWQDENELADAFVRRKGFAYDTDNKPQVNTKLLSHLLASVDLTYQNLESVELGVTSIDHYFDSLGGISRAVYRVRGGDVPVYVGDQTRGEGVVRTLSDQVALETRTRTLNPKWYEALLAHGHEGVRNLEAQVTNTLGWSATAGGVAPWIYKNIAETYMLDPVMRERLSRLNPTASMRIASRLIEAHERNYWTPDQETLTRLRQAGEAIEDQIEGIGVEVAA
jgi:magnesium chelatase subunit H